MCALSQTYKNIEIIVSDNSDSEDIKNICAQHSKVIYRKNTDGKPSSNIAKPLSLAQGEYIKYLFDDDLIYPHCIDSMLGWLSQLPENLAKSVGLITSSRHLINDESVSFDELKLPEVLHPRVIDGKIIIKNMLINHNNFIGEFSTILFKRKFINQQDPENIFSIFNEEFKTGLIDVPLYISILSQSNMFYLPYSLSAFRKHKSGGSDPSTNPSFHHAVSDWFRLIQGAYTSGLLSSSEAITAAKNYLALSKNFLSIFPSELQPWDITANQFIKSTDPIK